MKINLIGNSVGVNDMFGISDERSDFLLEHICEICENVFAVLPKDYIIRVQDINNETLCRLDYARILKEIIKEAECEAEKDYMLYLSHEVMCQLEIRLSYFRALEEQA